MQKRDAPVEKNPLKLIDFGLAEYCEPGEYLQTAFGTVLYVAPEVTVVSLGINFHSLL